MDAVLLIIITFLVGYVLGWLFALVVEMTFKKKR
jgi:LPS O-antigen subunit length determinant protein (WzzB/FepE family)